MVLIYTHKISNRIKYIFGLYLKEILGTHISITTNAEEFQSYEGAKFSYAKNPVGKELFFACTSLLYERGIKHIDLNFSQHDGLPAFFPVYNKESALNFDPFAAGFYLVTRYEEYLPYKKDQYGRFSAMESINFKKGFLHKPVVNLWALKVGRLLSNRYPGLPLPGTTYRFIPTIDIDAAWSYRQKGFFRSVGGYLGSLLRMDFKQIGERTRVLSGIQSDPFDNFTYIHSIHTKYRLYPIFFILFADYGFNDKNIPVQNRKFKDLIKSLADFAEVGIHPSYNSNTNLKKLRKEIEGLSKVLNREVTRSRQHFLKVLLPVTYRNLINLDITDDYSMGFAAQPGFRAGICTSFNFYDLDLDVETKFRVHPFALMEGTLRDYMGLSPEKAMIIIKQLIDEVKAVNGTFISLWHNESLSDLNHWKGWRNVYEFMISEAVL